MSTSFWATGLGQRLADGDLTAVLAAVAAPALLAITDRVFRGALGMGDLKLAVSLGLMFGITQLFVGFLVGTVAFARYLERRGRQ